MLILIVKFHEFKKPWKGEIFVARGVSLWKNNKNNTILAVLLLFFLQQYRQNLY